MSVSQSSYRGSGRATNVLTHDASHTGGNQGILRGNTRGRGQGRGRGRGHGTAHGQRGRDKGPRPTHFLALPLHTHETLRSRVSLFQNALLSSDPPIQGLDPTIIINPVRLHLTLGVMPLTNEGASEQGEPRTPQSALALLRSLQPSISRILADTGGDAGVKVPLEELSVFPPGATSGANVLWFGPDMRGIDDAKHRRSGSLSTAVASRSGSDGETMGWKERLWRVSDFIHQEFKKAGYITENRPLKLHCTIVNTSHRRPRRREPFSYEDVLKSSARQLIELSPADTLSNTTARISLNDAERTGDTSSNIPAQPTRMASLPLPVNLGTYDVNEVQLWVMGSRTASGEYVSLGGIPLE